VSFVPLPATAAWQHQDARLDDPARQHLGAIGFGISFVKNRG
jgi:hypothetical protein